jgi:hypothetical protein
LKQVPHATAEILRNNRTNLSLYDINYWGDMPLWSRKNNFIVTNFISDNMLKKQGCLNIVIHEDTIGNYKISNHQPPGSRSVSDAKIYIPIINSKNNLSKGIFQINFYSNDVDCLFHKLASHAVQFLVHPQFYC